MIKTPETFRHLYLDFLSFYLAHPDLDAHTQALVSSWENIESEFTITINTNHLKYFTECHFYSLLFINNFEFCIRFLMADFKLAKSIALEYRDTADGKVEVYGDFNELQEWLQLIFNKHMVRDFLTVIVTPE